MASAYKRYRRNSPEAVAGVLAALVVADGRLDPREVAAMDELGVFAIVGISRELFLRVVGDLFAGTGVAAPVRASRSVRLDAALDAVSDRDRQLLIAAVLLYLAEADRIVGEEEVALVRHVFQRWDVTAQALESELKVPAQRTRAFLQAHLPGAA